MPQGLHTCLQCPFKGPRVGSKGDPNSPFVIIGESPGKHEVQDKEKRPFVGPSGKVLDHALRNCPVEPYYINAMMCYPGVPDEKDESTMHLACANCRHHVLAEINIAPRKVILALGAPALWSITNNYNLKITKNRGKFFPSELASIGMVPSVHPAFLMRGGKGGTPQQFFRDVVYAIDLLKGGQPKQPPKVEYEVAKDLWDIYRWSQLFQAYGGPIAADIETSSFQPLQGRILCIGFAMEPERVYVVPEHLVKYVNILFRPNCRYIWHNGQFDVRWLWFSGHLNARVDEDTILLSYTNDENGGIHSLDQVASDWLNSPNWEDEIRKYLPRRDSSFELVPRDILHKYMAYDVGNTRAIFDILRPKIAADKHLERLYTQTLIPATNFLARVELRGIHVDIERVKENTKWYQDQIKSLGEEIIRFSAPFKDSGYTDKLPNSHVQLKKLIYDDLRIPKWRNKRSTDKKVVEHLPAHPVLTALSKYRKVAKEFGTYVKALAEIEDDVITPNHIQPDGKVHSSISLYKTRTGRLASNDPNVQNVPRNPQIRGQYVAAPGRRLIEVDLNQAELRILATLSADPTLCHIYLTKGMSLHDEVRAEIWGYPNKYSPQQLSLQLRKFRLTPETRYDENRKDLLIAEQKMRAKNVNFGTVYGITAAGLAEQCDCTVAEAQEMLDAWFKKFPGAAKYIDTCKMAPFKGQTLVTVFGRKKRPGIVSQELAIGIMNEFANFPEQSPASDITLRAGFELEDELEAKYNTYVCNLIHDALLLDAPDDDAICKEVEQVVIAKMEDVPKKVGFTRIPFVAEAKQGYRWGSLKG